MFSIVSGVLFSMESPHQRGGLPNVREARDSLGEVVGRIGGALAGYDIHCTVHDDIIEGRIGGLIGGGSVRLEFDPAAGTLVGRVGGALVGKDVEVNLDESAATGRFGGLVDGADISLWFSPDGTISGRCGGQVVGFDCEFRINDGRLKGRMGGVVAGKDADVSVTDDVPPLVAATLVALGNYYFNVMHRGGRGPHAGACCGR